MNLVFRYALDVARMNNLHNTLGKVETGETSQVEQFISCQIAGGREAGCPVPPVCWVLHSWKSRTRLIASWLAVKEGLGLENSLRNVSRNPGSPC